MGTQTKATKPSPSPWPPLDRPVRDPEACDASEPPSSLARELQLALAREKALLEQAEEFEHRLFNSVQMIVSLLASQSRTASPEAAAQLSIAINRIVAFGHVHRRLHQLDRGKTVQFSQFLQQLCADLSLVFAMYPLSQAVVVESEELELPTELGGPLGFIVSELVTNAAKHGKGSIQVRLQSTSPSRHRLSVSDDGPGLPEGFQPAASTGLGMKIVRALAARIGGELHWSREENGRGTRFEVTFSSGMPAVRPGTVPIAKESP
jgi:two-component sensor histidine kinase